MTWELPAALQPVHGLVAPEAPWRREDESRTLDAAGAWLDLAAASQSGRAQSQDAVAHVRAAGNLGSDVSVFEDSYGFDAQRMDDDFLANALVGTGTTTVVVLRTVWKYVVVLTLIALLLSLVRGFRLGPALGALFARQQVLGARKALGAALGQVERNIATGALNSLHVAKRLLARGMVIPALQTAGVAANMLSLDPYDDNPEARRDAEAVLRQTPEGREALRYAAEHGITALFQQDRNSVWSDYNRDLNVVRIGGAGTASAESLAAEYVRQVEMLKDRWNPSPMSDGYMEAREKEERAANQAAYRMGSQLGHEQEARERFLEGGHGSGYQQRWREREDGLEQAILGGPFRLFNDGPLDFT
ncbi:hypothetical protein [Nonomuraea candida]|uniref:hypothetical protein n=1 Tax=Nonomuraea candida TaxID=359159 RepID=UPI0005B893DD|nr:hypothetical protein [Nonomuraea candida]